MDPTKYPESGFVVNVLIDTLKSNFGKFMTQPGELDTAFKSFFDKVVALVEEHRLVLDIKEPSLKDYLLVMFQDKWSPQDAFDELFSDYLPRSKVVRRVARA